jgi:hypothetical protein
MTPDFEPAPVFAGKLLEWPAFNHQCPQGFDPGEGGVRLASPNTGIRCRANGRSLEMERKRRDSAVSFQCLRLFLPLLLTNTVGTRGSYIPNFTGYVAADIPSAPSPLRDETLV